MVTDLMHDGTDWAAGLTVETTVTAIDPEGLGMCVAELPSPAQADFLVGLVEGFSGFESRLARDKQLLCIGDELAGHPSRLAVVELLGLLVDFLGEGVGRG